MIPVFPAFKKIELEDREAVESYTHRFPPYSDFEFASLWAWNTRQQTELSCLNGNLAVKLLDYQTSEPFYTFIGNSEVDDTATNLLRLSIANGTRPILRLIPESVAHSMDRKRFILNECRDHFDYIYELDRFLGYEGGALKTQRNFLNGFIREYSGYRVEPLDLRSEHVRQNIALVWRHRYGDLSLASCNERNAHDRFVEAAAQFRHLALGIRVENTLAGYILVALLRGSCANGLFCKSDHRFRGIHATLLHEVTKELASLGYTHLNYQQDLGIEGLRRAKTAFRPSWFLKKYAVS